jgi:hypothetical protein
VRPIFFSDHFLNEAVAFHGNIFPQRQVLSVIEVDDTVHDGLFGFGVDAERIIAPQYEVGILALP